MTWISISLIGLTRLTLARRRLRFDADETKMMEVGFPHMPPHLARRLFDQGAWVSCDDGHVLAVEGQVNSHTTISPMARPGLS